MHINNFLRVFFIFTSRSPHGQIPYALLKPIGEGANARRKLERWWKDDLTSSAVFDLLHHLSADVFGLHDGPLGPFQVVFIPGHDGGAHPRRVHDGVEDTGCFVDVLNLLSETYIIKSESHGFACSQDRDEPSWNARTAALVLA